MQFLMSFFEDRMWTILNENTNKYVHTKFRQAKDNWDKDPIELLSEGPSIWSKILNLYHIVLPLCFLIRFTLHNITLFQHYQDFIPHVYRQR